MQLAKNIKKLRKELGWTQAELAEKANLAPVQLGRYENEKSIPTIEILVKLAEAMNSSIDFLVFGQTEERANQQIQDQELLTLFSSVEKLENEDKKVVKVLIDALVTKRKLQAIA
ncbi:helix-turn-helix transcriptional regulator [Aureispira sp. CCB-E]|uniref:helix-turn-helix domain-containing protein n=1 Tax=Aureispira sp. CCB-E TaxID=3051121 RepID=UPI0028693751|nr:helix-turn-helix transcriptional regulator [Aureispira sp. CCB-E]WMX17583.1 helix-turn-helix transcriptional regulator [Aureispira sp. CCB-E]WMX17589.1 helix-turn-helix transcriptional regulator [Aureispira sp. CCB-E]